MKIKIKKGRTGRFRFVMFMPNNKAVASSQTYSTKAKCFATLNAIMLGLAFGGKVEVIDTTKRSIWGRR